MKLGDEASLKQTMYLFDVTVLWLPVLKVFTAHEYTISLS